MTTWGWAALGFALLLVRLGEVAVERVRLLGNRGRPVALGGVPPGRQRWPSLDVAVGMRAAGPVAGVAAFGLVTVRAGPVLGIAAALVGATAGHLLVMLVRQRTASRAAARLLAAVRLVVAELEAGSSAESALRAAGEVDPRRRAAFAAAAARAGGGDEVAGPFLDDPDLRSVGHAWTLAAATGAPVAAVLARVADDLAARAEQARVVASALAGPRSSAVVLAVLPAVGIVLGYGMGTDPLAFLLRTPPGQLVCLLGAALDVAGVLWTRRLARPAALP